MKFQGFVGPSYTLDSVNVDCQRSVNLYPELIESGTGKEGERMYLKGTPGMEELFDVGTGPIRCIFVLDLPEDPLNTVSSVVLVVSGADLYQMTYDGTTWTSYLVPSGFSPAFITSTGIVKAAPVNHAIGSAVFTDGEENYLFSRTDNLGNLVISVQRASGATLPIAVDGAKDVVSIDGYLIYSVTNSNQFYVTDWSSITVDPLSFASAEGSPDKIVALLADQREIWLLNERTTEVFANSGNADFPFERVSGGFLEIGCVAFASAAKIGGVKFWLGRSAEGEGIVYAFRGLTEQRISTHALEQAIQSYADISSATAYTYQSGGHNFYVLNFAEMTWVYDLSTGLWHERAYTGETDLERHIADCHAFYPNYRLHMVGHYNDGKVYKLDESVYTDDGNPITRLRTFPHLSASGKRIRHNSLTIDMETGVGLDGDVQGSDPQIMLDWSNDKGHTWSSEQWGSLGNATGQIGDYNKRVEFRRLGRSRDRVYRLKITDPVKTVLQSAEIEIEVGNS